ncbi:MAG: SGNH/GDSL hydrolase family protein [Acidobacteriota bacterium]
MQLQGRLAFWLSSPILLLQGRSVRRRAPRFPGAEGPDRGRFGERGQTLRLLGLGDSIVAGVGAPTLSVSMVGTAARLASERFEARVAWQSRGEIGARAKQVREIAEKVGIEAEPDFVVLSVGVNDVTGAARTAAWQRDLEALLRTLRARFPAATIVFAGLPPLGGFPLLPNPLRTLLGWRARWFDEVARRKIEETSNAVFVPITFETTRSAFSEDGFHPSEASHLVFGQTIAEGLPSRR